MIETIVKEMTIEELHRHAESLRLERGDLVLKKNKLNVFLARPIYNKLFYRTAFILSAQVSILQSYIYVLDARIDVVTDLILELEVNEKINTQLNELKELVGIKEKENKR